MAAKWGILVLVNGTIWGATVLALGACKQQAPAPKQRAETQASSVGSLRIEPSASHPARALGTLILDFPGQGPNQPVSVKWADQETWPKQWPSELKLPLDEDITIWASRPGGPGFERKIKLTRAAPNARVVVSFPEAKPLGLFGFTRSQLPVRTGFLPGRQGPVARRPLLFELGAGPDRHRGTDFGIDDAGGVVSVVESSGSRVSHIALGRVDPQVLSEMTSLARKASRIAPSAVGVACNDCGVITISFWTPIAGQRSRVELATDGEIVRRISTPEAETLVLWLLAVREETRLPANR